MKIDIGGGTIPAADHVNLDPKHGEGEFRRRIQDGIPVPDDSLESARCSHLLEHIPAGQERIDVMNEVWRALRPGGTFEVVVPLMVPGRWEPLADPTHVSFWVYESFLYFTGEFRANADYGIREWQMLRWFIHDGFEGHALLVKP